MNSYFVCYLYDYSNTLLPVLTKTITLENTTAPATSFIAASTLYSFFSNPNISDTIIGVNLLSNTTVSFTLPSSRSSLACSPNRKYAIILNKNSKA